MSAKSSTGTDAKSYLTFNTVEMSAGLPSGLNHIQTDIGLHTERDRRLIRCNISDHAPSQLPCDDSFNAHTLHHISTLSYNV